MASSKFYVVWKGKTPGIYTSWDDCKAQVHGVDGARYKSFKSKAEAQRAYTGEKAKAEFVYPSISVDAACSGNPGLVEYQAVDSKTKALIFKAGPFEEGTNNIGEFLGLVHALAYLKDKQSPLPVYTDSKTAMAWVRNKQIKSTLAKTEANITLWALVDRAEAWLAKNSYSTQILKWNTEEWGEIPADFGRK